MTKTIRIDDNAHNLLEEIKKEMKQKGIESPNHSDCIRYINQERMNGRFK